MTGIVVDALSEVLNIGNTEVEDIPIFGLSSKTDYILGMVKAGDRVKMLLYINKVIEAREMEIVHAEAKCNYLPMHKGMTSPNDAMVAEK